MLRKHCDCGYVGWADLNTCPECGRSMAFAPTTLEPQGAIMTKRTQEEILAYIASKKDEDFFGAMTNDCLVFLDFQNAKQFLKDEITEETFNEALAEDKKHVNYPPGFVADYLPFAWDKANNCRGLSAGRSIQHLEARLWLCGYDVSQPFDNYQYYGKRQLVIASLLCDFDWRKHDNGRWANDETGPGLPKDMVEAEVAMAEKVAQVLMRRKT